MFGNLTTQISRLPWAGIFVLTAILSLILGSVIKKKSGTSHYFFIVMLSGYFCTIYVAMFGMMNFLGDATLQLTPFKTISNYMSVGNYAPIFASVFIIVPLVPLLMLATNLPFKRVVLLGAIFVIALEPLQFVLFSQPHNVIDIDDFILNAVGLFISVGLGILVQKYFQNTPSIT